MHVVQIVARVVLGVVFVLAGASKVYAGREWPEQAGRLGVPPGVAMFVPWFELAVGAVVVAGVAPTAAATVALVTLATFTALLARTLRQGRRPPCACFGAWSARPLGWHHVVRNGVLMALAVVAVVTS
ncbi:MAG: MauE/DoxX family redox-associated membrane protein [Ilumatobacteraceae bacterium]